MQLKSIKDTKNFSKSISELTMEGDVIFLYGEIGVGKTTFSRLLINSYEKENKIKKSEVLSPTFNIVFEYEIKKFKIQHFDLYRLKNISDIKNIGLFENNENILTIIEWPELIRKKPINRIDLFFKYKKDYKQRSLNIKTNGRLKIYEF